MSQVGRNVWFDLMTTDVEAAKRFYTEVVGWKAEAWAEGDPDKPYTMWMMGEIGIGGVVTLPEEAKKMGAPPHWMAYTTVDDVDEAAARAEKLGGRVAQPPFDVPNVGRIAVLLDPQGAAFSIYKSASDSTERTQDGTKPGEFSWAELNTTDGAAAWKFYSQLFGWKERGEMDMGEMGKYRMWNDAKQITKGGMTDMAKHMKMPPMWLHYINVDDIDAAVKRVEQYGGAIFRKPEQIPEDGGMIAVCKDPQGAMFAFYAEGKK